MRTVEKRWETRIVIGRCGRCAARGRGVAFEQGMFRLGVQRRGRLVEISSSGSRA